MMLVIVPAAFAFSRLEFKGKNLLFALFLSLMMIPTELVIITNYVTIVNWGFQKGDLTYLGLILPICAGADAAAAWKRWARKCCISARPLSCRTAGCIRVKNTGDAMSIT